MAAKLIFRHHGFRQIELSAKAKMFRDYAVKLFEILYPYRFHHFRLYVRCGIGNIGMYKCFFGHILSFLL